MASNQEVIERFVDFHTGRATRILRRQGTVWATESTLYSYGTHFPLAQIMGSGEDRFWLLNGDNRSVSTARHQRETRSACNRSGLPVVILPFSALDRAGIDHASIRPVDVQTERTWYEPITVASEDDVPANARWDAQELPDGRWQYKRYQHRLGAALFTADYATYSRSADFCRVAGSAYFLSDFDYQERRPLYFLAQLPEDARPTTVEDALAALAPIQVKLSDNRYGATVRQGDMFAIPSGLSRRELARAGATFGKRATMLATRHSATEVALLPDGQGIYARGCLYHEADGWRAPEHRRQKIGDGKVWALIARNTVPWLDGSPRAWTVAGGVD